jgi:hypothetical protein
LKNSPQAARTGVLHQNLEKEGEKKTMLVLKQEREIGFDNAFVDASGCLRVEARSPHHCTSAYLVDHFLTEVIPSLLKFI